MIETVIIAGATCVIMMLCVLFLSQIKIGGHMVSTFWAVPFIGAIVTVATGQIDLSVLGKRLIENNSVNPVKILVLFISMTVLSVFLDEVGFFKYLAVKALSSAGESQVRLFVILYATVSVLTVFTSNDVVVLTFTPFICYFTKNANISPVPYLVAEFIAANTMSMMFIIGNPTNIYIASSYNISFARYFLVMALPTVASAVCAFGMLWLLFKKQLKKPLKVDKGEAVIKDKLLLIIGLADLGSCTLILAVGSYFGIEMWIVSLVCALLLFTAVGIISLVRKRKPRELAATAARAPWSLVPFVLSMFVIILAMSENGVTEYISRLLGEGNTVLKYGAVSFLSANLINNIPMSVLFCPIIGHLPEACRMGAVYAAVIGSNLGAYLTPIGALAGIMWMSLLKVYNVRFKFTDFCKYGVLISVPTLAVSLAVLGAVL